MGGLPNWFMGSPREWLRNDSLVKILTQHALAKIALNLLEVHSLRA